MAIIETVFKTGTINRKSNSELFITLNRELTKGSCTEKGCNLCSTETPPVKIKVKSSEFNENESVIVKTIKVNEALAAFILFGVPIIVAIIFYSLAVNIFSMDSEGGITITLTLVILLLSTFIVMLINNLLVKFYPFKLFKVNQFSQKDSEICNE